MKRNQSTSLMIMLAAAAGLAAAGPDESEQQDKSLLKGPSVVQTTPASAEKPASDPMQDANKGDQPKAPTIEEQPALFREYSMAIRRIADDQVDENIALSDQQRRELRLIMIKNRDEIREFQMDNREKMRALRAAAGMDGSMAPKRANRDDEPMEQGDDQGDDRSRDAQRSEAPSAEQLKARQEFRRFIDESPPNRDALAKVQQLLTPAQNELVLAEIMTIREKALGGDSRGRPGARGGEDDQGGADRRRPERRMDRDQVDPDHPADPRQEKRARRAPPPPPPGDD